MQAYRILVLLLSFIGTTPCYKILVYTPKMGHSHVSFLGRIADTLVEAGHEVVVYLPEYDQNVISNGTKLARTIHRKRDFEMPLHVGQLSQTAWTKRGEDLFEIFRLVRMMAETQRVLCERQLQDTELLEALRAERFDLGIAEVISSCGFGLFQKIGLNNYVGAFATNLLETVADPFGTESNPSFVPAAFSPYTDVMAYKQRVANLVTLIVSKILKIFVVYPTVIQPFRKYIRPDFDSTEVIARSTYVVVNADEFLEFPRPINHKIVYIGGIAVPQPKPLGLKYKRIMDQADAGAVLVSFGSIAKSSMMPDKLKTAFSDAFRKLNNVTFIWKYELDDDLGYDIPNLVKKKWVPQNDLLSHPNMRAFVSHCGLNSLTESVHAGVPIICIPLFGDQMRNSKMAEKRGVGVVLDKMNLNADIIVSAFEKVLYQKSFRESSALLARMIAKKPISVKQRLVKHIEFAAEFGAIDHLDPASRRLNFFQYYLLDIIVPFIVVFFLFTLVTLRFTYILTKKFLRIAKVKLE